MSGASEGCTGVFGGGGRGAGAATSGSGRTGAVGLVYDRGGGLRASVTIGELYLVGDVTVLL